MRDPLVISAVTFAAAPAGLVSGGLLGWASFDLNDGLRLEAAVRHTRDDRFVLSFPSRRTRDGARRSVVQPTGSGVRQSIEDQVLAQLRAQGVLR